MPDAPETPGQPEAPDAPDTSGAPDGRDRLRSALLRPTRGQLVVALLLALLGFATVTQVRANEVDDSYAGLRQQDLIDVLNGLAGARRRAEAERAQLEETRDELRSTTSRRRAAIEQAETEIDALSVLAGLVPVTGPGIRVTISEGELPVSLGSMLDVLQELRTAEAEAMQVNGKVRVVAETAIEDVTGGFLVDGTLVEPPYVIDVIGEPTLLAQAIDFIDGPRRQIEEVEGGEVEVDELATLDIEAVRRAAAPEYAAPDVGQ